ncbi:DUF6668 family protein [Paraoerskovia sediminicola]|uniref:DUF6668 family protein n=1 Tax=Paraoerskovia sediminicola TaxID=1138587 RepID=UPI003305D038
MPAPDRVDQLPIRSQPSTAALWCLGAHGGAGESSLAELDPEWSAAGHAWPVCNSASPSKVILVARSNARGLRAAQAAATQWAAGLVSNVELLGLAIVADAPGRLPRALRHQAQVIAGESRVPGTFPGWSRGAWAPHPCSKTLRVRFAASSMT